MDLMVTLRGAAGEYRVPSPWWVGLVGLAVQYGWQPSLASRSTREVYFGELVLDRVTDGDARALSDALAQALPDVPDQDALAGHPGRKLVWDPYSAGGPFLSSPPTVFEWFSGDHRHMVVALSDFARAAGFRVDDPTLGLQG